LPLLRLGANGFILLLGDELGLEKPFRACQLRVRLLQGGVRLRELGLGGLHGVLRVAVFGFGSAEFGACGRQARARLLQRGVAVRAELRQPFAPLQLGAGERQLPLRLRIGDLRAVNLLAVQHRQHLTAPHAVAHMGANLQHAPRHTRVQVHKVLGHRFHLPEQA
jgi:hypothetical protein